MAKKKRGKNKGGNAHDRAAAKAKMGLFGASGIPPALPPQSKGNGTGESPVPPEPPRKPDIATFLTIVGIAGTAFLTIFLTNVMEVTWWISGLLYVALGTALVWTLKRHAVPHLAKAWQNAAVITAVIVMILAAAYGTFKQYKRDSPPSVTIYWPEPKPIFSDTPLTIAQLNAKVTVDGNEIEGDPIYIPTAGATLPEGRQTLTMTFTPREKRFGGPKQQTTVIIVNPAPKRVGPPPITPEDLNAAIAKINNGKKSSPDAHAVSASVQTSLIAFGRGNCSMFMAGWGGDNGRAFATPIVFLLYMRINSKLDHSVEVDNYSVEVSSKADGPWIPTRALPMEVWYTRDNSLKDTNTRAFRATFAAIASGSAAQMQEGGIYPFSSVDDNGCLKKASLVRLITLNDQLKSGLLSNGSAEGWAAFNPSADQRALLLTNPSHIFFRIRTHTTAGDFTDYGEFHSLIHRPEAAPGNDNISMVKFGDAFTDLSNYSLRYLGP